MATANETATLRKCKHACTICQQDDVTIHHIDGNHSNDDLDNLTVLCQKHHAKAQADLQTTISLTKKLTPEDLKYYRENWIRTCHTFPIANWVSEKEELKKEIVADFVKTVKELGWIKDD